MLTTTTKQNRQNNNPLKGKHFWGLRKIVEKANNRNISKFWNQFFSGTKLFFAGKDTLMTRISPHFHQTAESSKAEICWTQVIGFVLEVIRLARRKSFKESLCDLIWVIYYLWHTQLTSVVFDTMKRNFLNYMEKAVSVWRGIANCWTSMTLCASIIEDYLLLRMSIVNIHRTSTSLYNATTFSFFWKK